MYQIEYSPLNQKAIDYIVRCQDCWLNVAEGGKRAGKNIMNLLAWAATIERHPDKLHLAAGVTIAAAKMNILDSNGFGLRFMFDGRSRVGKYNDKDAIYINCGGSEKVVIFAGGGKVSDAAMIKGQSYGTAYITEVNECHPDFMQEVLSRTLASHDRKIFFDLNPKPPRHWFYTDFLDDQMEKHERGENPRFNYEHFTILDNMSLSDAQLRETLGTYNKGSIWYKADILGLRTASSGRIYTSYSYEDTAISPEEINKLQFAELSVGVDVGGTDATCATLTGITKGYDKVVHIDGMYHKQGIDNKMTEAVYARMVVDWLIPWVRIYPQIGTIYADSANKLFRTALKNELISRGLSRFSVIAFDKSDGIMERIELSEMLLHQGRYKICSRLDKWHQAYQDAVWSDDYYEKGQWVRVDDGSYPVDCLDSSEYSLYPLRRFLVK